MFGRRIVPHSTSMPSAHRPTLRSPQTFALASTLGFIALFLTAASFPTQLLAQLPPPQPGLRATRLAPPSPASPRFSQLPEAITGIHFTNTLQYESVARNRHLELGSGVALGDVDGDGLVDLYFCALERPNALFRNLGGWRFADITASAGVACPGQFSTGCALVDTDGDGDLDLFVNSLGGGTRLFLNNGKAQFTEVQDAGLHRQFGATSLAFGDIDGDGDLDLYVPNYRTDTLHDNPPGLRVETRTLPNGAVVLEPKERFLAIPSVKGGFQMTERGEIDTLYMNRPGKAFVAVPWNVGVFLNESGEPIQDPPTDWGLAALFRDFNGDGAPDLYVCNDFIVWPDRLWLNQGSRRFRAAPQTTLRNVSLSSMSIDVADINRDGLDDFFVAEMLSPSRVDRARQRPDTLDGVVRWPVHDPAFRPEAPRNTLHLNRGNGAYSEIAAFAGVAATDWTWCSMFLDADLDGWEDLLLTAGQFHDVQDIDVQTEIGRTSHWKTPEQRLLNLKRLPRRPAPSLALRNQHDLSFTNSSSAWGLGQIGLAHGMAAADLDGDGDLDLVVNAMNEPARILRNNSTEPRIAIRLKGAKANTRGIHGRIRVTGGPVPQSQEMIAAGRYLSCDDALRVFAAGAATSLNIEVTWRNGQHSTFTNLPPNHLFELDESASARPAPAPTNPPPPLFESSDSRLKHTQTDTLFDDFESQPLLPKKLSALGPGAAWIDANLDGHQDLALTGGADGRAVLFLNNGQGEFSELTPSPFPPSNRSDQIPVLAWRSASSTTTIAIGSSDWETHRTSATPASPAVVLYTLIPNSPNSPPPVSLPPLPSNKQAFVSALAAADVNGDGTLELFAGSRAIPGAFPIAPASALYQNTPTGWAILQEFPALGAVSSATFADLDADGDADLALALEWGPIRVFMNENHRLIDRTRELGLESLSGWWNGIATGDFNEDGRLDLAVSNWGRNWRLDAAGTQPAPPVQLFYGDFAEQGSPITLLASLDPALGKITPWRSFKALRQSLPEISERIPSHRAYSTSSITEILGPAAARLTQTFSASLFDSGIFLNTGARFEFHPLPSEAQWSPAFAIIAADFDGDGHQDLFLSQNFFGMDPETSRQDAGLGLVLRGQGDGSFAAIPPAASGIALHGEQRGAAVADIDHDGRPDLVATQNAGPSRLFRNAQGHPGVRIVARASNQNPEGVGAILRLRSNGKWGAAQSISKGAGYASQNSSEALLGAPGTPEAVRVLWPGGRADELPWPAGAKSVQLVPGSIQPIP